MYKTKYTPQEAHEHFTLIEESNYHEARKERMKRYVQARIVEDQDTES